MVFAGTAVLMTASVVHLYMTDICPQWSVVVFTVITQGCKLLHLWGVSSPGIVACFMLIFSFTVPYIIHATDAPAFTPRIDMNDSNTQLAGLLGIWAPHMHGVHAVLYLALAAFSCSLFNVHGVMHITLLFLSGEHPSELEELTGCLTLFFAFAFTLALVFFRKLLVLRR